MSDTSRHSTRETKALEHPLSGPRVLISRTGLAMGTFLVLSAALYLGYRHMQGKPLELPTPRYFPSKKQRAERGGPLPTAAQRRIGPPPRVSATVQPIEAPAGAEPLAGFFEALRRTERKEPGAITRVSHWGDSQIVSDNITSTLRRRFQKRFGDAGHGFISVGRPASYLHQDVVHRTYGEWKFGGVAQPAFRDHCYGLGGMHTYASGFGPIARFSTRDDAPVGDRVSRFEVWYLKHFQGGRFQVKLDGELHGKVKTRQPGEPRGAVYRVRAADGAHKLTVRSLGYGVVRLLGVVMERDVPGVVYDSLGLKGAQMHNLLGIDEEHFLRQLRQRRPDLVVLGFGTNESYQRITMEDYKPKWRELIRRMRKALPGVSCLMLGPVDRVYRRTRSHPRTEPLTRAMREAALAEGCGFWDTFQAMGGDQAGLRWRRAGLMWGDLAHLNPEGGEKLGGLITTAILERYTYWKRTLRYRERLKQREQERVLKRREQERVPKRREQERVPKRRTPVLRNPRRRKGKGKD